MLRTLVCDGPYTNVGNDNMSVGESILGLLLVLLEKQYKYPLIFAL